MITSNFSIRYWFKKTKRKKLCSLCKLTFNKWLLIIKGKVYKVQKYKHGAGQNNFLPINMKKFRYRLQPNFK
jgi:hypothetical protein